MPIIEITTTMGTSGEYREVSQSVLRT